MRTGKRILSMILTLAMCLSIISVPAFAGTADDASAKFVSAILDDTGSIQYQGTGFKTDDSYTVTLFYNGKSVKSEAQRIADDQGNISGSISGLDDVHIDHPERLVLKASNDFASGAIVAQTENGLPYPYTFKVNSFEMDWDATEQKPIIKVANVEIDQRYSITEPTADKFTVTKVTGTGTSEFESNWEIKLADSYNVDGVIVDLSAATVSQWANSTATGAFKDPVASKDSVKFTYAVNPSTKPEVTITTNHDAAKPFVFGDRVTLTANVSNVTNASTLSYAWYMEEANSHVLKSTAEPLSTEREFTPEFDLVKNWPGLYIFTVVVTNSEQDKTPISTTAKLEEVFYVLNVEIAEPTTANVKPNETLALQATVKLYNPSSGIVIIEEETVPLVGSGEGTTEPKWKNGDDVTTLFPLTWQSSNVEAATVNQQGVVTGVKEITDKVTITAAVSGYTRPVSDDNPDGTSPMYNDEIELTVSNIDTYDANSTASAIENALGNLNSTVEPSAPTAEKKEIGVKVSSDADLAKTAEDIQKALKASYTGLKDEISNPVTQNGEAVINVTLNKGTEYEETFTVKIAKDKAPNLAEKELRSAIGSAANTTTTLDVATSSANYTYRMPVNASSFNAAALKTALDAYKAPAQNVTSYYTNVTVSDSTVAGYDYLITVSNSVGDKKEVTLKIEWPYTVKISSARGLSSFQNAGWSYNDTDKVYSKVTYASSDAITLPNLTETGYTLKNWTLNNTATVASGAQVDLTRADSKNTLSYVANWTKDDIKVSSVAITVDKGLPVKATINGTNKEFLLVKGSTDSNGAISYSVYQKPSDLEVTQTNPEPDVYVFNALNNLAVTFGGQAYSGLSNVTNVAVSSDGKTLSFKYTVPVVAEITVNAGTGRISGQSQYVLKFTAADVKDNNTYEKTLTVTPASGYSLQSATHQGSGLNAVVDNGSVKITLQYSGSQVYTGSVTLSYYESASGDLSINDQALENALNDAINAAAVKELGSNYANFSNAKVSRTENNGVVSLLISDAPPEMEANPAAEFVKAALAKDGVLADSEDVSAKIATEPKPNQNPETGAIQMVIVVTGKNASQQEISTTYNVTVLCKPSRTVSKRVTENLDVVTVESTSKYPGNHIPEGETVTVTVPAKAKAGDKNYILVGAASLLSGAEAYDGKSLRDVRATDLQSTVNENGDTVYTFKMVDASVILTVTYAEIKTETKSDAVQGDVEAPSTDINYGEVKPTEATSEQKTAAVTSVTSHFEDEDVQKKLTDAAKDVVDAVSGFATEATDLVSEESAAAAKTAIDDLSKAGESVLTSAAEAVKAAETANARKQAEAMLVGNEMTDEEREVLVEQMTAEIVAVKMDQAAEQIQQLLDSIKPVTTTAIELTVGEIQTNNGSDTDYASMSFDFSMSYQRSLRSDIDLDKLTDVQRTAIQQDETFGKYFTETGVAVDAEKQQIEPENGFDISVPFKSSENGKRVFIQHLPNSESVWEILVGTVTNNILTFKSAKGASPFVVTVANPAKAYIGSYEEENYYSSLTDALAHAKDGDQITVISLTDDEKDNGVKVPTKELEGVKIKVDGQTTIEVLPLEQFKTNTSDSSYNYEPDAAADEANNLITLNVKQVNKPVSFAGSTTNVVVTKAVNGSVKVSSTIASAGSKVTVTMTPDKGYVVDSLIIKDKSGNDVTATKNSDGTYTFTMPAANQLPVTVTGTFKVKPVFVDVEDNKFYSEAVAWAVNHEPQITNGTDETHFSPFAICTRSQVVTFLWRAAGTPEPKTTTSPFVDLGSTDSFYYKAVLWAVENGITNGTDETHFSPDATVTRGQVVTFLYRYEKATALAGDRFEDVAANEFYAAPVNWAYENGITNGTSETMFSPKIGCTRAEIVTFLFRDLAK